MPNEPLAPVPRCCTGLHETAHAPGEAAPDPFGATDAWFRSLIENSSDMISVLDASGRIEYESPSVERILGLRPADLIGESVFSLIHPDDVAGAGRLLGEALENPGRPYSVHVRFRAADGRWRHLEATGRVVPGPEQTVTVVLNSRDVTPRIRQQAIDEWLASLDGAALEGCSREQLIADICREIVRLVPASATWIDDLQPDGTLAVAVEWAAPDAAGRGLVEALRSEAWQGGAGYLPGRTAHDRAPRVAGPETGESTRWCAFLAARGMRLAAAYPLFAGDRTIGVLNVAFGEPGTADEWMPWLAGMAPRISLAILRAEDQGRLRLQSAAIAAAANAIFITDLDGRIQWVNAAFTRLTEYTAREAIGQTPRLLKSGHQREEFYRAMWNEIRQGREWRGEIVNRTKSGRLYNVEQTVTPLRGPDGAVTHFVAIHEDITEQKQSEARILHMAHHDALTGLPNRILLRDRLQQALTQAKRDRVCTAVLFMDLDRFKLVNDTLGHGAGDLLLESIAERLIGCIRAADTVARLSGDEFMILLPRVHEPQDAVIVAEKILARVLQPVDLAGRRLHTSASIGIAVFPADGTDPDELIRNADTAMYRAKKLGGNGYQLFTPEMHAHVGQRLRLENAFRRAVHEEQFVLHYQTVVDLETRAVAGLEALVRWNDPDLGLMSPETFIPLAEETGFIVPLGDWVLRTACRQARRWHDAGYPLRLAVNLSPSQLRQRAFEEYVARVLEETGFPAEWLDLELTETVFMSDPQSALSTLQQLKRLGVGLALDDFGTGYASLSYVKRFPVDTLKIDRSFVHGIPASPNDTAIVGAIMAMAGSLGLRVIAEGIERAEQLTFLMERGCRLGQGFMLAEPRPADDLERLLAQHGRAALA